MAYWVKINYERSIYLIDLDSITAFSCQPDKRITFWLPNSSQPIILSKQNSEHDYYLVLGYIKKKIEIGYKIYNECWVKIIYDRHEWLINLSCITTFAWEANGRITFWLPDSTKDIIINPNSNPEAYEKVLEFINKVTGNSLP
ncbi:MAG: hypothetical protein F6K40_09175 [Okeania sp. SIO3I5]|uniref:hypothetical protein n=1 Tax=Okeania sp. SIO3I5 TaxID=2607805 RepID=UPI0013BC1418|nr:hypothetical protein [Okeania sp. SIO3I5]NEQ36436.1 hypothetical protein [Okeania sp. SIO3I5]